MKEEFELKLKKITAVVLSALMVASASTMAVTAADIDSTNPYEQHAAELDQHAYTGSDLGSTYSQASTVFKVWAPKATNVKVNLYATGSDTEAGAEVLGTYDMTFSQDNGVWEITVDGDLKNVYYTYSVTTNGVTKEVVDVYAKAVGVEGDRGMVVDLDSTNPEGWDTDSNFTRVANQTDANVWEAHIKDFSYDASSGVSDANRGKYLAFTEDDTTLNGEGTFKTGTSYIKDVGYNYVQINPFYDFGSVVEAGDDTQFNWGYDPKNYNAPEGSYSSNPYDGNVRINEAKQMVQGLHDQGIGVIMDVVYNHTQSRESWLQQTVPDYYYRINADGTWSQGSGCGNDTASERAMYRKYMIDSVTYWAKEYHVDGFRFDLMGLHDAETMNAIRAALDEIDPDIIMYGEGWSMASTFDTGAVPATQANSDKMSTRIGFFNDQIRDGIKGSVFEATGKGYIQGSTASAKAVALGLGANTASGGNWKAQEPEQTVTYDSCHDNATLYDRLVYSLGGEFNERNETYVQMSKLASSIVFGSQGTGFVLAGEEFARTKLGDENSYVSSPDINKLDWTRIVQYADVVSYYQGMLEFKNYFDPMRTTTKSDCYTSSYDKKGLIISQYTDTGFTWDDVVMLYNNSAEAQTATIPNADASAQWVVVVNGDQAGIQKITEVTGNTIEVPATSALFLVDKASYDASDIKADKGIVKVEHINQTTGEVMSTVTLTGTFGQAYQAMASSQYDLYYNVVGNSDNTSGTYSKNETTVKFYYEPNLLTPKDVTGDGVVNMKDIIAIQKHIAKIDTMTEEQIALADTNRDGIVNMADVILYQKHVAKFTDESGIGTVTTNYFDADGKQIADSTVQKLKVGDNYTTSAQKINFYNVDEAKLPANATGKVKIGNISVDYYYNFEAVQSEIHVYVPTEQTWVPNFYAWEETPSGTVQDTGAWPGKTMTPDTELGDGWYSYTLSNGGNYNWIINGKSGQTADQKNYSGNLWIYMKNGTTVDHVDTNPPA